MQSRGASRAPLAAAAAARAPTLRAAACRVGAPLLPLLPSRGAASPSLRPSYGVVCRAPTVAPAVRDVVAGATKKGGGSTHNGRDSIGKRRGIKVYGEQDVKKGGIIVRQVGSTFHAGRNVGTGKDYTLYALIDGVVRFQRNARKKRVHVIPPEVYGPRPAAPLTPGSRKWKRLHGEGAGQGEGEGEGEAEGGGEGREMP